MSIRWTTAPQRDALRWRSACSKAVPPIRSSLHWRCSALLAEVAEASPLVCLIDDAQWLDQASARALTFVARRLLAERIAVVIAGRDSAERGALDELPELVVEPLADDDARVLLTSRVPGPLDARVRERIIAEAHGNPLALLELPRALAPEEVAGGFARPDALAPTRGAS
jgi:predicted ATPase